MHVYILVFKNFLWVSPKWLLANFGELGVLQNFYHISISPFSVPFFLPRCKMTAYEAEACLMQRHANTYAALESKEKK